MGLLRTGWGGGWGGGHGIRLASRREGGWTDGRFESDENRWFDNNTQTVGPVESPGTGAESS